MHQINITLEKFRKILFLGIVLLLGLSTGSSYANSIFSENKKSLSDGFNSFNLKHSQPAVFLFSSEIEDVEEEVSDDEHDTTDSFILDYHTSFVFRVLQLTDYHFKADFFAADLFFTKFSRFIVFRNIRI